MTSEGQAPPDWTLIGNGSSGGGTYHAVRITGAGSARGRLTCQHLRVTGHLRVQGDVRSEEIQVAGHLRVAGDCSAESFDTEGAYTIRGLLNAGRITIRLVGAARAAEMGGTVIHVTRPPRQRGAPARLTVAVIEGDTVHVEEATHATVVRGRDVDVGPGCVIDRLEYSRTFHQSPQARVTHVVHVEA